MAEPANPGMALREMMYAMGKEGEGVWFLSYYAHALNSFEIQNEK